MWGFRCLISIGKAKTEKVSKNEVIIPAKPEI
jgi:hypothetical protein